MSLWRIFFLAVMGCLLSSQTSAQEISEKAVQSATENPTNATWLNEHTSLEEESTLPSDPSSISSQLQGDVRKKNGVALQLAFVNLRRVMASIPQLTILRGRLDGEFAQQKAELDRQSDEIQQLENQLADMPRGDEYSELEKQVIAKRRTFARINASFRDAYSVRRNEELATLQQQVVDEIVSLAKEEGYDVILNDTGVIYVSADADLTLVVIERLRQQARLRKK